MADSDIHLVECFNLARWDTMEQATERAKELHEETGIRWYVLTHHHHYHVLSEGGYFND